MKRVHIRVGGQVQGVGFRPFVYKLATLLGVTGTVGNTPEGVVVEAQGSDESVGEFVCRLQQDAPPLACIVEMDVRYVTLKDDETTFRIETSFSGKSGHAVLISPDVAVCADCLRELFDSENRRFLYPFINCTNCGPRFTITHSIPYDRASTAMACFPLCPDCAKEYADPADRRFHAQPNACAVCGPQVWVAQKPELTAGNPENGNPENSNSENGNFGTAHCRGADALRAAAQAIVNGNIVAVRGLGGFHLTCDARNPEALAALRRKKQRPHKSLAVMAKNLDAVRRVAMLATSTEDAGSAESHPIAEIETALLASPACPIVILPKIPNALPEAIAPDVDSIGVMLPSTPLHHALLHAVAELAPNTDLLVMTSGNARGEPLCLGNREALAALGSVADLFLLHNRDILVRADDSVLRVMDDKPLFYRRARGYTPSPLPFLDKKAAPALSLIGLGAHLKATMCATRQHNAFVSQHIGDMENSSVTKFYTTACEHMLRLLEVEPQAAVCDLHPDYHSTRFAKEFAAQRGIPLLQVQHHVAHHHAVLGEHSYGGPALGLVLDGTGYGIPHSVPRNTNTPITPSAPIWGGELLLSKPGCETRRIGRLSPFALPGGEAAIREPWRLAVGMYPETERYAESGLPSLLPFCLPSHLVAHPQAAAVRELSRSRSCLHTSSCGRLFDAVSALLNVCTAISYEGQAAIRLEHVQNFSAHTDYLVPLHENTLLELDAPALFAHLAYLQPHTQPGVLARVFHLALMTGLCRMVRVAADIHNVTTVTLSGGVFQNSTVTRELPTLLRKQGLTPLLPSLLPPGDGALSYGQVVWAATTMQVM